MDEQSITPKYVQIVNAILDAVKHGNIGKDYHMPSINDLSYELNVARDTAEKAYRQLKQMGVLASVPGKGYFISGTEIKQDIRVMLMFNKLSAHKKIIYDSFVQTLGNQAAVDFYVYNNNYALFSKLIRDRKKGYSHFVIIPHFTEGGDKAGEVINEITEGQLVLLDKLINGVSRPYAAVYENFSKDIYNALQQANEALSKYDTLKLIFPENTYFPTEIINGFEHFCRDYAFQYRIVDDVRKEPIHRGEVYINLMEDDLVHLLEKVQDHQLIPGKDIGIISYNETPWKRFILNGITTISTDFKKMGEMAAQLVVQHQHVQQEVPFALTLRDSL